MKDYRIPDPKEVIFAFHPDFFKNHTMLLQKLGCQEGTLLNYLIDQQWYIQTKAKTRHKVHFRSSQELADTLGIDYQNVKAILKWFKQIGLVKTERKGWPAKNNFYLNCQRILDVMNGPRLSRMNAIQLSKQTSKHSIF